MKKNYKTKLDSTIEEVEEILNEEVIEDVKEEVIEKIILNTTHTKDAVIIKYTDNTELIIKK